MIAAYYCPNLPWGPFSVYAQHRTFFVLKQDTWWPQTAFTEDFSAAIITALEADKHTIAMLDRNSNMRNPFSNTVDFHSDARSY